MNGEMQWRIADVTPLGLQDQGIKVLIDAHSNSQKCEGGGLCDGAAMVQSSNGCSPNVWIWQCSNDQDCGGLILITGPILQILL
ncbi:unnamed protein product [Sphagnum jensenii]|jgi:hypothetical protein|uniref:Uncharacterized protein n=1 Tax=Sphagnum jensenii TaxID=128206 RepID=A0ABP0X117_9BRYO